MKKILEILNENIIKKSKKLSEKEIFVKYSNNKEKIINL